MSITQFSKNKRSFGEAFEALKVPEAEGFYTSTLDGSVAAVDPGKNSIPVVSKIWSVLGQPSQSAPKLDNIFLRKPGHQNSFHEQSESEQKVIASFTVPSDTPGTVAKYLDMSGYPEGQIDLLSRGQCLVYIHSSEKDIEGIYPVGFFNRENLNRPHSNISKPNPLAIVGFLKDFTLQNLRSQTAAVNTIVGGREHGILNYWLNCSPKPVVGVHLWFVSLRLKTDHGLGEEELKKYYRRLILPFTSYTRSGTGAKGTIFRSLSVYTARIPRFQELYEIEGCTHVGVSQCKNQVKNPLHYKNFIESYLFCDFEEGATAKRDWERAQWEVYFLQKRGAFLTEVRLCP